MSNSIAPISKVTVPVSAPDPVVSSMIPRPAVPAESPDRRPEPKGQAADLRLVIEEDQATGGFIYKTLDRRTGEVVKVLPREEVLKLKASEAYSPGTVVSTFD